MFYECSSISVSQFASDTVVRTVRQTAARVWYRNPSDELIVDSLVSGRHKRCTAPPHLQLRNEGLDNYQKIWNGLLALARSKLAEGCIITHNSRGKGAYISSKRSDELDDAAFYERSDGDTSSSSRASKIIAPVSDPHEGCDCVPQAPC